VFAGGFAASLLVDEVVPAEVVVLVVVWALDAAAVVLEVRDAVEEVDRSVVVTTAPGPGSLPSGSSEPEVTMTASSRAMTPSGTASMRGWLSGLASRASRKLATAALHHRAGEREAGRIAAPESLGGSGGSRHAQSA
jgi:hypothetical protein